MDNFQFLKDLNYLDIGFVLVIFLLTWRGVLRGFFAETFGLLGVAVAFVFAGKFYHQVEPYLEKVIASSSAREIVAYAVTFLALMLAVSIAGRLLSVCASVSVSPLPSRIFGGVAGFSKGVFLCAVFLALIKRLAPESKLLNLSVLAQPIGDVAKFLYSFLPNFI